MASFNDKSSTTITITANTTMKTDFQSLRNLTSLDKYGTVMSLLTNFTMTTLSNLSEGSLNSSTFDAETTCQSHEITTFDKTPSSVDPNKGRQLTSTEEAKLLASKILSTSMAVAFPIGLIINIISLIVLCKGKNKSGTEIIFIGLTFVDMLSNASGVWTNMIVILSYYTSFGNDPFIKANFKYILRADIIVYMASFTISATLAIERVFAVFKPMSFREIWTPKFNFWTILIGPFSTISLFLLIVVLVSENAFLILRCVFTLVILVVVILSNILTLVGLKVRVTRISLYVEDTQKYNLYMKERRQTKILVSISTIFIFCGLTNSAVAWASLLDRGDFELSAYLAIIFGYIRWIFQVIYSILNSSIFVLSNRAYRRRLKKIFCFPDDDSKSKNVSKTETDSV